MFDQLTAVEAKIGRMLSVRPQYFVTHPAELRPLKLLSNEELHQFAESRGWRAVRRIGGHQIEFYNDAALRTEAD
jgi:hypothetical protein